ncbi:TetR/AcrR family transcriptional regulator [Paenibacillus sp. HJGM_3]|uniref:TetR/AcrR family transcriptional regulator n=1 Tax=Paenibacillus sp. HJGM_3 TaxID=3379816 RepID=UPI00385910A6
MSIRKERKDAAEHRALILKTAQALFREHGLEEVSMHQIAKSAGIGQGTLYRRYANKTDLCADLMQDSCTCFREQLAQALREAESLPVEEQLGTVLDHWMQFIDDKSEWLTAIQVNKNCDMSKSYYFHSPFYQYMHDTLQRLIRAYADREGRTDLNPDFTAHVLMSAWDPSLFVLLRQQGYTSEQIRLNFRQLFLKSLSR